MKKLLLISSILLSGQLAFGTIFTVNSLANTNTGTGTTGTLRFCMNIATITPGGPHTITFSVAGTIAILSDPNVLPTITSTGLIIDGTTAPGYAGIPLIIIDGAGTTSGNGITISTTAVTIKAMDITNSAGNGISVSSTGSSFMIDNCVLRNSGTKGLYINGASNGTIKNSRIGVNNTGTICEMNQYDGIDIQNGNSNQILDNHIACNGYNGIQLGSSDNNIIKGNTIGPLMGSCTFNGYRGIDIEGGSMNNIVGGILPGEANKIAGNDYWGIEVKEAGSIGNIISGNSMSCNAYDAIDVNTGGNNNILSPVITAASGTSVSGTSLANAVIEIFRAQDATTFACVGTPDTQGADYIGTTTATAGGTWTLAGTFSGLLVATQRTIVDGSSSYSNTFSTGIIPTWINECSGPVVGTGVAPVANFSISSATICAGDCVTFTDISTNSPTSWAWTFTGGSPTSSATSNQNVCYNTAGTFNVSLDATNAFGTDNHAISVVVLALPTINITQIGSLLVATAGHTSYQWYLNGGILTGETNDSLTISVNGNYTCIAQGVNGCSDTSAIFSVTNLSLGEFPTSAIKLYPNPSSDQFTISISAPLNMNSTNSLSIINSMGQLVYTTNIVSSTTFVNTENFSSGMYSYIVKLGENNIHRGKIVVKK
jgi:parallel beta-helix repeat protein